MLENLIERAQIAGFQGITVWKQGKQFMIAGMTCEGKMASTRMWEPADTMEAAIIAFGDTLSRIVPGQGR